MLKQILLILFLVPIAQFAFAEEIPDYDKPYAPIFFNKPVYSWTEKVEITIIAPSWNTGMNLIDSIGGDPNYSVDVYTKDHRLEEYKLYETDPTSGIFTGEIILTGFLHDVDGDGVNDTNPIIAIAEMILATNNPISLIFIFSPILTFVYKKRLPYHFPI